MVFKKVWYLKIFLCYLTTVERKMQKVERTIANHLAERHVVEAEILLETRKNSVLKQLYLQTKTVLKRYLLPLSTSHSTATWTHTHTHTCTHTTHTNMNTHICIFLLRMPHTYIQTYNTYIPTIIIHTNIHTYILYTYNHHAYRHKYAHGYVNKRIHALVHKHARLDTNTHRHRGIHINTDINNNCMLLDLSLYKHNLISR